MANLISFLVFGYNHERFIAEAVRGALGQTYEPLEIVITDDCSTDATAEIIERELAGYTGPHRIRLLRNEHNRGLAAVINEAVRQSTGAVIIGAAGDDVSLAGRCSAIAAAFDSAPDVMCVWSDAEEINQRGEFIENHYAELPREKTLESFGSPNQGILGATAAYRREVFDRFGPLSPGLLSEDRTLSLRAAILGKLIYVPDRLVQYRRHIGGLSRFAFLSRNNEMSMGVVRQRLLDIEVALKRPGIHHAELRGVKARLAVELRSQELDDALYKASWVKRLFLIATRTGLRSSKIRSTSRKFLFRSRYYHQRKKAGRLGAYSWQH